MDNIYDINPNINIDLAINHGFIKNNIIENEYRVLQKKYYLILELYLYNNLKLSEIENKLNNSKYFSIQKEELIKKINIKNIKFNYFFIRNNLNIEVLSSEQLNLLKEFNNIEKLIKLVEETFLEVIKVNFAFGKKIENTRILYDGTGFDNLKNNDSLIIGFINEFPDEEISDEEWDNYYLKREQFKNENLEELVKKIEFELNCKVELIEYTLELLKCSNLK